MYTLVLLLGGLFFVLGVILFVTVAYHDFAIGWTHSTALLNPDGVMTLRRLIRP